MAASVSSNLFRMDRLPVLWADTSKRSMKDIVCDKVAALISSGMLQVGDVMPGERELSAALQVSRETVRGAIQALAQQGILEVSHGSRTRVLKADVGAFQVASGVSHRINSYDLEAVHATRLLVECSVLADAARSIDETDLAKLEDSLAAQREALSDPMQFLICDREFHGRIYRGCGNPLLADFVTDLYTYMMDYRRKVLSRSGAIQNSYDDHFLIFEALRTRDADAAVKSITVHLDRIYTTTRSLLATSDR